MTVDLDHGDRGDRAWRSTANVVSALVLGLLGVAWGPVPVAGLFVASSAIVCALIAVRERQRLESASVGQALRSSPMYGAWLGSSLALSSYDGWIGLLVITAFAASSPPARRVVRTRPGSMRLSRSAGSSARLSVESSVDELPLDLATGLVAHAMCMSPENLADDALAWAWRLSYNLLQLAEQPEERASVTRLRQGYLDEMERRNPAGLTAWLDSGARAAGDPARFLRRDTAP